MTEVTDLTAAATLDGTEILAIGQPLAPYKVTSLRLVKEVLEAFGATFDINFAAVESGKKSRLISGTIRNTGSGWGLISDADHRSTGISGVSTVASGSSYAIRLTFSETAADVGSFIIVPDETYGRYGLICGSSVATTYADVVCYLPFSCKVSMTSGAFTLAGINAAFGSGANVTIATSADDSTLTITHEAAMSNDAPAVTPAVDSVHGLTPVVSYTTTTIVVKTYDDFHGRIYYDGADWQVDTPNIAKPTMSFVGGVLTVTHEDLGSGLKSPVVGGVGGVALPAAGSSPTSTTFAVVFYDYTGTLIEAASTSLAFTYRHPRKVLTATPDGVSWNIRRGPIQVDPDRLTEANGNLWFFGEMAR